MAGESQQLPASPPDPTVVTTALIHSEIKHLRELMEARLDAVHRELDLAEHGRVEQKTDTQTAVNAAFAVQKEAVRDQTAASDKAIAKSEEGTAREIAQMSATFGTSIAAVDGSLDDLKERVSKIENMKLGGQESRAGMYAFAGFLGGLIPLGAFVAAAWPS